jgi:hypothetical protein
MTDPRDELRRRGLARHWSPTDRDDTWSRASPDGSEEAVVRVVGGAFRGTGGASPHRALTGPDPEPSHGPRVFEAVDEALDDAEANLGADTSPPDGGGPGV